MTTPVTLDGGDGRDKLIGGGGPQTLLGGNGKDLLKAGLGQAVLDAGSELAAKSGKLRAEVERFLAQVRVA